MEDENQDEESTPFSSLFDFFIDVVNGTNLSPNSIRNSRNLYREVYNTQNLTHSTYYENTFGLTRSVDNLNRIVSNYITSSQVAIPNNLPNNLPINNLDTSNTANNMMLMINEFLDFGSTLNSPNSIINTFQEFLLERDLQNAEDVKVVLSNEEFDTLEKININEHDKIKKYNNSCYICIEEFLHERENTIENTIENTTENTTENTIEKNVLILTKCNHLFHENCIKQWLTKENVKCPVCRTDCRN